ncbi:hypothetical protein [Candidatus Nitrospira bockiana]
MNRLKAIMHVGFAIMVLGASSAVAQTGGAVGGGPSGGGGSGGAIGPSGNAGAIPPGAATPNPGGLSGSPGVGTPGPGAPGAAGPVPGVGLGSQPGMSFGAPRSGLERGVTGRPGEYGSGLGADVGASGGAEMGAGSHVDRSDIGSRSSSPSSTTPAIEPGPFANPGSGTVGR